MDNKFENYTFSVDIENNIGEKIKNERLKKNITQKKLAELSGISQQSIAAYEKGLRNPSNNALEKISNALNTSIKPYMVNITDSKGNKIQDNTFSEISEIHTFNQVNNFGIKYGQLLLLICNILENANTLINNKEYDKKIIESFLEDNFSGLVELLQYFYSPFIKGLRSCVFTSEHMNNEDFNKLLSSFKYLNDLGTKEAVSRVEELTHIPKYTDNISNSDNDN